MMRSIGKTPVCCPRCHHTNDPKVLEPAERCTDNDVVFSYVTGEAHCVRCGHRLNAHIGGWIKPFRATCQGCGDPLTGRQTTWCSRSGFGWEKLCSVAWDNPTLLAGGLRRRQQNLCGICVRPMDTYDVEVDHVVPLAANGPRTVDNLRTTHRACNQAKKARSLAEARVRMGLTDTEVLRRLAGAAPDTVMLLKGPPLPAAAPEPAAAPAREAHPSLFDPVAIHPD